MKITVNGKDLDVELPFQPFSYEEVCAAAGKPVGSSVTYQGPPHGDSRREGSLRRGQTVELEDGMQFSAYVTDNA